MMRCAQSALAQAKVRRAALAVPATDCALFPFATSRGEAVLLSWA